MESLVEHMDRKDYYLGENPTHSDIPRLEKCIAMYRRQ